MNRFPLSRFFAAILLSAVISTGLAPLSAVGATISISGDPSLLAPGGFFFPGASPGKDRFDALMEVKGYVESTIANPGTVTISISVFTDPSVATLASGGQFFKGVPPAASGIVMGDVHSKLIMGTPHPDPQGFIMFNTAKDTYLGADPIAIPSDKTDFRSIILHELTHALGWESYMKPDDKTSRLTDFLKENFPGTYGPLGEVYSKYDTFLVDSMSKVIILPSGAANPDALPIGGGRKIASPMAIAANAGDLIPTAVVPFIDGDMTHLDGAVLSTMNPTLPSGKIERTWTAIDLGVLKDLGYTVVPEPTTSVLMVGGLFLISVRSRQRQTRS